MVIHLTKAGEGKIRDRGLRSAWPFNFAAFSVAACLSLAVNLKRFCWQGKRKSEGKVGWGEAKGKRARVQREICRRDSSCLPTTQCPSSCSADKRSKMWRKRGAPAEFSVPTGLGAQKECGLQETPSPAAGHF